MCGVVGIYSHDAVASELYDSLIHLQHRGQDAAGILTCNERFFLKRGVGLVRDIFASVDLLKMQGNFGIGHTRYPTAGGYNAEDVQPLWIGSPRGIALAHNGNLINYTELAREIKEVKQRHLNSSIDSEVLLHCLADGIAAHAGQLEFFDQLKAGVQQVFQQAKGSYSVVSVIIGKGLVAFRDPHGIRPLVLGERMRDDGKKDYIIASETTMFYALGFKLVGDVLPGEIIFIDLQGKIRREQLQHKTFAPCIFEYVYFARPDSTLNGVSVYQARLNMGERLAHVWQTTYPELRPDVVIPTPFTSNTAAIAFANKLQIRYAEGLYKNPFIGRTFIMADGKKRSQNVRYKLTPQQSEIAGLKVLILDDSIVRGTTSREIIKMIREYGALEIYFVSTAPPIKHPCFYGVDIPSTNELIAAQKTETAIAEFLGVDILLYQTLADLAATVKPPIQTPCMACMNGKYVTGHISTETLQTLAHERAAGKSNL
jgi:amidophosphoribosyltransferase